MKSQTFLWAGLYIDGAASFSGEVVADQFGKNERRFPARVRRLDTTETGS
ncbi:MAG: hypothetical protein H7318_18180 [Oligoflexus sp.]|nr:hypothetical protein [Oligoflexus sp.]